MYESTEKQVKECLAMLHGIEAMLMEKSFVTNDETMYDAFHQSAQMTKSVIREIEELYVQVKNRQG